MRSVTVVEGCVAAACLLLTSCAAHVPRPPKPGTPEFFWMAAHASFEKADFEATHRNLDQLALSGNPYRNQAAIWLMTLSVGLAHGSINWAKLIEQGPMAASGDPAGLHRQAAAARKAADHYAMHLAELVEAYHAGPRTSEIPLGFSFPSAVTYLPAEVGRLRISAAPASDETRTLRTAVERRAVVLSLCRLVDAEADPARARALLIGSRRLAPAAFEWYLAQELDGLAELYSPQQLDQASRARLLLGQAAAALAACGGRPEAGKLAAIVDAKLNRVRK